MTFRHPTPQRYRAAGQRAIKPLTSSKMLCRVDPETVTRTSYSDRQMLRNTLHMVRRAPLDRAHYDLIVWVVTPR